MTNEVRIEGDPVINEAAEPQTVSGRGLAAFLNGLLPEDKGRLGEQIAWLEEQAAAAERRATVERIRFALHPAAFGEEFTQVGDEQVRLIRATNLEAILDAEAAR